MTIIKKILFATDLSKTPCHAFPYAAEMAGALNAGLTVLHIAEKLPPNAELFVLSVLGLRDRKEIMNQSRSELVSTIREHVGRLCGESGEDGRECRIRVDDVLVEPGDPAARILHHAATGNYDALVIGRHGRGVVEDRMVSRVFRKVVFNSPIPVFIVPIH